MFVCISLYLITATFPCTHCIVDKQNLGSEDDCQPRTLSNLATDFKKVEEGGFTAAAKKANHSVSHEAFFNIPVDQVSTTKMFDKYMYVS